MTQHTFRKFIPLTKVEEASDGSTHAYGIVTGESPDKEGEICDYKFAKKSYQSWSQEAAEATKAAGQDLSLGNIRLQHTLQIAGKAIQLDFDDKKKLISLGSQTEDADIRKLLKGGYVRGYSQGGAYAFRKCNDCESDIPDKEDGSKSNYCPSCKKNVYVRYGPVISEVSYVDNPCFKQAKFQMVKGAKFELAKADGSKELVGFAENEDSNMEKEVLDRLNKIEGLIAAALGKKEKKKAGVKYLVTDDDGNGYLPYTGTDGKPNHRLMGAAWAALFSPKGHRGKKYAGPDADKAKEKLKGLYESEGMDFPETKKVTEKVEAAVENILAKAAKGKKLNKNLYDVSRLASILQDFAYIRVASEYEREREGDESELPEDLQEILEDMAGALVAMAEEEAEELTEAANLAGKTGGLYMSEKTAGLEKAAQKAILENAKAMKASVSEHGKAMCDHIDKLSKILGAEETGEKGSKPEPCDPEEEGTKNTLKAAVAELTKTVEELKKGATAAAATEKYVSLGKTEDGTEVFKKVAAAAPAAAPAATDDASKPVTKADLDAFGEKMFNAGAQSILKALKGEEEDEKDEKEKDCDKGAKVKKANASTGAAPGIGDRANTTLLNGGPILKIMPVTKADDAVPGSKPADVQPAAVDVTKAMSGDVAAGLAFMKSAKPTEIPATISSALSQRHHSSV